MTDTEIADEHQRVLDAEYAKPRKTRRAKLPVITAGLAGLAVAVAGVGVGISAHSAAQTQETKETVDRELNRTSYAASATTRGMVREVQRAMDPTVVVSVEGTHTQIYVTSIRIGDRIEVRGITPDHGLDEWSYADDDETLVYQANLDAWWPDDGRATIGVPVQWSETENLPESFEVTVYRAGAVADRLVVGNGG